jgi:ATP-dependent Clp protease ATP-binding subunit ClpB
VAERLEDKDISVNITDSALEQILRESYNASFGARPMRRYIEKHLATALSRLLIAGTLTDHSVVDISAGSTGNYSLNTRRKMVTTG